MIIDEIRQLLQGIEDGSVKLKKCIADGEDDLSAHYGNMLYIADNGWRLSIFFDCGGWDYIDSVIMPNGKTVEYDDLPPELMYYRPPEQICIDAYGSPGYLDCHREES